MSVYEGRRSVPLKSMCSTKWEIPCSAGDSKPEPMRVAAMMETERACGTGVTST